MEKNLKIFNYNDNSISFQVGESTMINATQMAKPFGKQPSDWLRLQQTEELISSLSAVRGIPRTGLIQIIQGGNRIQGTFLNEDLALLFAQWLSPSFYIWCNDRIKELLLMGKVENNFKKEKKIEWKMTKNNS
ncbi:MAG: KilA-N domain-containing protein [Bacteroidales bacterium]|nr:KilA-N domain-containing protein [Bacteroidales bacterium]